MFARSIKTIAKKVNDPFPFFKLSPRFSGSSPGQSLLLNTLDLDYFIEIFAYLDISTMKKLFMGNKVLYCLIYEYAKRVLPGTLKQLINQTQEFEVNNSDGHYLFKRPNAKN